MVYGPLKGYLTAEVSASGSKRYISTYVMIFIIMVLLRSKKLLSRACLQVKETSKPHQSSEPVRTKGIRGVAKCGRS